jgi:hypothetical protein
MGLAKIFVLLLFLGTLTVDCTLVGTSTAARRSEQPRRLHAVAAAAAAAATKSERIAGERMMMQAMPRGKIFGTVCAL